MMIDPAPSRHDWRTTLAATLPQLTLVVFVVVTTFGAFSGGLWGGAGIGGGVLLYAGTAVLDRRWPRPSRDLLLLAVLALAVMAALNLGSSRPSLSWYETMRLATIFLPLALLTSPEIQARADHKQLFTVMALTTFAGSFALGMELVEDVPVLHLVRGDFIAASAYNRGLSHLVILALPILAALWTQPVAQAGHAVRRAAEKVVPFALFVAVLLFPAGLTESRASKLALVVALVVVAAAYIAPKCTRWSLGGLVLLLLGWPFAVQKGFLLFHDRLGHLPASWRMRVEIWDYMSYRIAERPWFGWGLGTSKTLDFQNPHGGLYEFVQSAAPHPHNVITQLWVELGLPGLALGAVFAFLVLRKAGRLAPPLVPFALGAVAAALCLSLCAYNFWTDAMFSSFALSGLAFALLDRRLRATGA